MEHGRGRPGNLGSENDFVAQATLFHPGTNDGFSAALGFLSGRDRVHFGSIEEIDSCFKGIIHLLVAFCFGILLAEGHRSKAYPADQETAVSKFDVLHRLRI